MPTAERIPHANRQPINWQAQDVRAALAARIGDPREEFDRCRARYDAAYAEHRRAAEADGQYTRDPRVKHPNITRAALDEAVRNFRIAAHWYCLVTGEPLPEELQ